MKWIVVDIQGFNHPEFYPKEISFINEQQQNAHYLLKPPVPYSTLSDDVKKQVRFLERHHHGLKYSSGCITDTDFDEILRNHLIDVEIVYVKGYQKHQFLEKRLSNLLRETPSVVNLEFSDLELVPNLCKDLPYCFNHTDNKKYMCSLRNVFKLYNYLLIALPK